MKCDKSHKNPILKWRNNRGNIMTDKEQAELVTKFGNEHTLAQDIKVSITENNKSFTSTKERGGGANYEDVVLLSSIIQGAEHFLLWLRRNNYIIKINK